MLLSYDNFLDNFNILRGDGSLLSDRSIEINFSLINNHFGKLFKSDSWDDIKLKIVDTNLTLTLLDTYTESSSMKCNILDALFHLNKHEDYTKARAMCSERKKSDALHRSEIDEFDWESCLKGLKSKADISKHDYQIYLMGNLLYYHPRRVSDYADLDVVTDGEECLSDKQNYYIKNEHKFVFNKFKNAGAATAGEKVVICHEILRPIIDKWLSVYNTSNHMFVGVRGRKLTSDYYSQLLGNSGLPSTGANRKQQTSLALSSGENPMDVAFRFNHSVSTQQLNYKKRVIPFASDIEDREADDNVADDDDVEDDNVADDDVADDIVADDDVADDDVADDDVVNDGVIDVVDNDVVDDIVDDDIVEEEDGLNLIISDLEIDNVCKYDYFKDRLEVSDASKRQIFDYVISLFKELNFVSTAITNRNLIDFLKSSEKVVQNIERKCVADISKRTYYYRLYKFSKALRVEFLPYKILFDKYDIECKSRNHNVLISDTLLLQLNGLCNDAVDNLPTLTGNWIDIMKWRNAIITILVVKLPTREGTHYRTIMNKDDGTNSFYCDGIITYRCGKKTTVVEIPQFYVRIFDEYHALAKTLSNYFIFQETGYNIMSMANLSKLGSYLLGTNIRSVREKWKKCIKKSDLSLSERKRLTVMMG